MIEEKVAAARQAIQDVFGETSVPASVTREKLEELRDEIETSLEALDSDGRRESDDEDEE